MEEQKEKEMTQQHHITSYSKIGGGGGGRDNRRGSKAAVDDWAGSKGDRGNKESSREKFDHTKVVGILSKRKEKGTGQVSPCTCMYGSCHVAVTLSAAVAGSYHYQLQTWWLGQERRHFSFVSSYRPKEAVSVCE